MTAPKSESTAVATRQPNAVAQKGEEGTGASLEKFERYGAMNRAARAEVTRARVVREVADMVALTEWGGKLTPVAQAAVAKWCIRRDVDPLTELDNVGGPYLNSEYWIRKLGELRVRGVVRDVKQMNVAFDKRLDALAKDQHAPEDVRERAKVEHYRRMEMRAQYGVPEEATGACLTLIYLAVGGEPIAGCKWGGGGTSVKQPRAGGSTAPNPIVENNPTLSVESQSIRRAMRQLALTVPALLPEFEEVSEEVKALRGSPDMTPAAGSGERDLNKTHRAVKVEGAGFGSVVLDDRPMVATPNDGAYGTMDELGQAADGAPLGEESDDEIREFDRQLKDEDK